MVQSEQSPLGDWNEDLFRHAVESSPSGLVIVDQNGNIVLINKQVERIFGYNQNELVGQPIETLVPDQFRRLHPELRNAYIKAPSTRPMGVGRDLYGLHKNKSEIPVEIGLNPITIQGKQYVLASIVNISERKQADSRFRLALEASPNGIVMIDKTGHIVLVNSQIERTFGYAREELIGKPIEILVPERYRPQHPSLRNEFLKQPTVRAMGSGRELYGLRKDNSEVPVEIGLNPLESEGQLYVLASVVDISERKRAETEQHKMQEQMQHTQRLESLGVLAGGIAHDFNNILVAILGHADLGLLDLPKESPVRQRLDNIKAASVRASGLTKQMLAYAGKGKFTIGMVSLNTLIQEMSVLLEVSIPKKTVMRLDLSDPLPSIEGDAAQLQQVIMNLITNASEAIGNKSGMIAVNTGVVRVDNQYLKDFYAFDHVSPGYYIYLEVADTGCGMSKETQARLFDPFFTTKLTGRGLGMAAVLGIIRSHRGTIKVYSEEGRGTKIKVIFPVSGPQPESQTESETAPIKLNSSTKRILLVDDEEHVRGVISMMLNRCGFETILASEGREGELMYKSNQNDIALVLCDMNMPGLDGIELYNRLKSLNPDVKFVLMSGYNEREATFPLVGKSIAGFLQKPFEFERLVELLKKITDAEG